MAFSSCLSAVFVCSLFIAFPVEACNMDSATIMEAATSCLMSNPFLVLKLERSIASKDYKEIFNVICKHESKAVNLVMCMINKLVDCMPLEEQQLMEALPSKGRLSDGLDFVCQHRNALENSCMKEHWASFTQCYTTRMSALSAQGITATKDVKGLVCSVIRMEEKCFQQNKGTCPQSFIDEVTQALEKFYPLSDCPKSKFPAGIFGNALVHGQPLRFQPWKDLGKNYVIKPRTGTF